ncbi:MAG: DUF378 domain-containing protein [bacterium]|nr:DUF378 domain-containing protein [bacterium]
MRDETIYKIAFILMAIGGINWLLIGLFETNLVTELFGGADSLVRLIYVLVGLATLYCLWRYFDRRNHHRV